MRAIFSIIQFSGFMIMIGAAGNNNAELKVTLILLFIGFLAFAGTEMAERKYIYRKKHTKAARRKKAAIKKENCCVAYMKKEPELC